MANRWEYHQDGRDWAASVGAIAIVAIIMLAAAVLAAAATT